MRKLIVIFFLLVFTYSYGQYVQVYHDIEFTYLEINPDARIGGFGEVDVVSSPFYYNTGLYRNPALFSKHQNSSGINISYMPYLKKTVDDLNFVSLNGYYALDEKNIIGLNFTMFDQGETALTNEFGSYTSEEKFYDLYFQTTYNHSFNSSVSAGISIKYLRSVYQKLYDQGKGYLNTYAIDLGSNFDDQYKLSETSFLKASAGLAYISNNLRFNIELGYQAEKYLVPTPSQTLNDSIIYDSNSDVSVLEALYESFYDAPGGLEEELHEIMHKFGSEFRLNIGVDYYIALRHGRVIKHKTKGNRRYQTFGLGGGYKNFMLDFKIIGYSDSEVLNGTWSLTAGYRLILDKI